MEQIIKQANEIMQAMSLPTLPCGRDDIPTHPRLYVINRSGGSERDPDMRRKLTRNEIVQATRILNTFLRRNDIENATRALLSLTGEYEYYQTIQ